MDDKTDIEHCKIVGLPLIASERKGSMTPIYNNIQIPFDIQRVYYLYDVPAGAERGGHAHKDLQQLIISVSGSFDVIAKDGKNERVFTLNRPFNALYIPRLIWRELTNFSSGSICLVLASLLFNESDYLRNYTEFIEYKRCHEDSLSRS